MKFKIHRGTHQIGGTCVEIESQGARLILDIGLPLDAELDEVPLPDVRGFADPDSSLLGIFISHPHLDHYGLAAKLENDIPILMGSAARNILDAAAIFMPNAYRPKNVVGLKHLEPVRLGPFALTPYLVDHSAYDAYALLVEADGERLFYSGDFRGHGRKGRLLDRLVADPPENVDVMLMEGSTLGRSGIDDQYPTEVELEEKFNEQFSGAEGMVLVWCSGQNIDRLVTVYKACRRSGRRFVADMYTAHILQSIGNPRLPQPGWAGFRVYLPWTQKQTIIKQKLFDFAKTFSEFRIYPEDLKARAGNCVMLFRPSMQKDLEKADCLDKAKLVYSLWSGYLEREQYAPFKTWLEEKSIPLVHCHTSGHAPLSDLKRLAAAIAPRMLVPIHTFEPDQFSDHFDNVIQQKDGQWWEIPRPDK